MTDTILLKLKRDFTHDEAVQLLLKELSEAKIEIGILKSELSEANDKSERIRKERTLTSKQWMQEEIFTKTKEEIEDLRKSVSEHKKNAELWERKYFQLLISNNNQILDTNEPQEAPQT